MRIFFLSIIILCAIKVNAQTYLITFAGIGASTSLSSFKVENLMKGTSLTLSGAAILRLTGVTGISSIENKQ
jgi:hypothetical protein